MKRFLILGVLLFLSFGVLAEGKLVGLSDEDFSDSVEVVVKMKHVSRFRAMSSADVGEVSYEILDVDSRGLDELLAREDVVGVYSKNYIVASMSEVVGIVNSTASNNLQIDSLNLTGSGQIVCVIDSGVNFSHLDLIGKNASCVVDCYDKACVENCSVSDDNGHGTHVAGIVGASGGLTGVAPNVSLIGVKILGSDGGGSGNDNDLPNAVDYCVSAGADVISMSLGTVSLYSSNCDAVGGIGPWKTAIDSAVGAGIAVVAASGNDASTTGISAPACLSNAIPVGDTYDANVGGLIWGGGTCTDATTALDQIVCHANRNSLVKLFAPGALVNSTWYAGGYAEEGGTSMATPVVSGAIAILKQYFNLSSQSFTPGEIEDVLNDTGKIIYDLAGSGLNFSRVDVYEALISVDVTAPDVTLVSPVDNHVNLTVNQSFNCSLTDWQLANLTFRIWNSSGLYYNESVDVSGVENVSVFDLTDMSAGDYVWNCKGVDLKSNSDYASANFSLTIGGVEVSLNSPANDSYTNVNLTQFNCSAASDENYELTNLTFRIWNSSGVLLYNESVDVSGTSNVTVFDYNLSSDDVYDWECVALNNNSDEGDGINYTVSFDSVGPIISSLSSGDPGTTSATVSWTTSEVANSSLSVGGGTWSNSSSYVTSHSVVISGLSSGTSYSYVVYSCDRADNCVNSSSSFSTDAVVILGGGGGGGSGGGSSTTSINLEQVSEGYSKVLGEGDGIVFDFYDGEKHNLSVERIIGDVVSITVQSEPVEFDLGVGQVKKLSLASEDYYDLLVRVDEVSRGLAKVYVGMISEEIVKEVVVAEDIKESVGSGRDVVNDGRGDWFVFGWIVIGVVLVLVVKFLINGDSRGKRSKRKRRRRRKGERGKRKKGSRKSRR